jgi:pilus assembly protein CpaF
MGEEITAPDPATARAFDPLSELKTRVQTELFRVFDPTLTDDLAAPKVRRQLDELLDALIANEERLLTPEERRTLIDQVADNVLGHGPIQQFLDDPMVSEIMVNAPDLIFVERDGRLEETDASFYNEKHLLNVIDRIVGKVGRTINESSPLVDARMEDGSRVNAVIPPLAIDSPTLTIRKFFHGALAMEDLIENGSITPGAAGFLEACVVGRRNLLVSGGTGTGKTTLLNALSSFIPEGERVITIEDTAELRLRQRHVVRMECREANTEGLGTVTVRDLVRNALRMRPDRIVVGECRGIETLDMLQAMNTGHEGSITTLHANSPRDALARMETMVLMAGLDLPLRAIREQVASAIDVVVQIAREADGRRGIVEVAEVTGMEGDMIQMNTLFVSQWMATPEGEGRRFLHPTGLTPVLIDDVERYHPVDRSWFASN